MYAASGASLPKAMSVCGQIYVYDAREACGPTDMADVGHVGMWAVGVER